MGSRNNKPGWKSSEFWLTIFGTNVAPLLLALDGVLPPKYAVIASAVGNGIYAVCRTLQKGKQSDVEVAEVTPIPAPDQASRIRMLATQLATQMVADQATKVADPLVGTITQLSGGSGGGSAGADHEMGQPVDREWPAEGVPSE